MIKEKIARQKELRHRFDLRINKDLADQIEAKAISLGVTPSELARTALSEYIHKDVNISNEVLGTLSILENEIEGVRRRVELQSNVFIYFLRFFFAFSGKDIEQVPKEMRKQFFEKGEKRRDDFIKLFRQQTANKVNIFELMLGEYLTDPVENTGGVHENGGMEIGD